MLAFIKANFHVGDSIDITCSQGTISGKIEFINENVIVLRLPNNLICGIAAHDVRTFQAEAPDELVTDLPPEETYTIEKQVETSVLSKHAEAQDQIATEKTTTSSHEKQLSAPSADGLTTTPTASVKVVGKIPLDQLRKIDPKFNRNGRFRSNEDFAERTEPAEEIDSPQSAQDKTVFVSAMGRITYYNADKRFGFIHDFVGDYDLYFQLSQVADPTLYDCLRKGTKVAYTALENEQGHVAHAVHLPHTVDELLDMAEEYIHSHHLQLAQGLLDHVLAADPQNEGALELASEITGNAPAFVKPGFHQVLPVYSSDNLYTKAKKAFLDKDFEKAEELYRKAIDAAERPDSSLKDLLSIFVTLFKQSEDKEFRAKMRAQAEETYKTYSHLLPDNLTNKQFVALNYYLPMQEYDLFIQEVENILQNPQVAGSDSKFAFYMWQKAIVQNKLGDRKAALATAEEGLKRAPRHMQLLKAKRLLEQPDFATAEGQENETSSVTPSSEESTKEAADETFSSHREDEATVETSEQTSFASNSDEPNVPASDTGEKKPHSWWEELKKPW